MIKAQNISYSYGLGSVFDKATFSVGNNMKAGLVGANGAGKTTLFRLIRGEEIVKDGKLEVVGNVGYVPQEIKNDPILNRSITVRDYVDPDNKKQDYELELMLKGLEMEDTLLETNPNTLSGGRKTKLALLRALIQEPNILLLDEPTNFLDVDGKKWVMEFLSTYPHTLLIISHDLNLLDEHIDKVIFIDKQFHSITEYSGNYSKFVKIKAEQDALLKRQVVQQEKHIARMEKSLLKLYKKTSKKGVRQRVMLSRRIERMKENLPELPKDIQKIKLHLPTPAWCGELVLSVKNINKSYNDLEILDDVSFSILRGERTALIGPNGVGKSTLIKIMMGITESDQGEIYKDKNIKIGYYSQKFETFDFDKTIFETVEDVANTPADKTRPFLARFLFSGEKVFQKVGSLSGGEKTRLAIALLMLHDYNLLILDEPTTYLDVLSQRIILDALKEYKGSMLIVSHTEEFIDEINPNRVLLLPENKVEYWAPELREKVSEI